MSQLKGTRRVEIMLKKTSAMTKRISTFTLTQLVGIIICYSLIGLSTWISLSLSSPIQIH